MGIYYEFFVQCALSLIMGGLIGFEREFRSKPAGLKTHVLICLGSTALTFMSIQCAYNGDPGRIAAQIVSGIGFIGAGTILHANKSVQGLTTAASIWVVAAIGMLIGAGMVVPAAMMTGVVLAFLLLSRGLTATKYEVEHYSLSIEVSAIQSLTKIEDMIKQFDLRVENKVLTREKNLILTMSYLTSPLTHHLFLKRMLSLQGIGDIITT